MIMSEKINKLGAYAQDKSKFTRKINAGECSCDDQFLRISLASVQKLVFTSDGVRVGIGRV